ncbi:MAG: F0F1 ATP synthase subunit gamma [Bacillota bacterium]|nr:F0F1 ATP synthase subunit gamma [Bacillota bacterium]
MSSNLEQLQKQISSGEDLSSIVRTMKALAATSVRQYEKAAESLDDYYHTVELGLSVVLADHDETPAASKSRQLSPPLLLLFGSDHGLAGRFNEQIVTYTLEEYWQEKETNGNVLPDGAVIAGIGEQVVSRIIASGITPANTFTMPTSISAITPFIQKLLEQIENWRFEEGLERVLLFYNRPETGGFSPRVETLLPVDMEKLRDARLKWQSRSLPTYTMPTDRLLSALLRQYFFVSLYRACALSLAAENTSRLAAMQAAEKNISERLGELKTAYQHERQGAITEELLDIISGFKAVKGKLEELS